ncbi:MAG: hypothetical protein ABFD97_20785 [Syntrophobacter sp.]
MNRESELEKAFQLRDRLESVPPDDAVLRTLYDTYLETIRRTDSLMWKSGVAFSCAKCAEQKGSCCFEGMDQSYGALLIYINMLMGVDFSLAPYSPASCRFVGKDGCRLKARFSFCLNYFCPDLRTLLDEKEMERIQREIGKQLFAGWELERALSRWFTDAQKRV